MGKSIDKSLTSGSKMNNSHQTFLPECECLLRAGKACDEVSKIVTGPITHAMSVTQPRIKIQDIDAGVKISIRGTTAVQDLYFYTKSPEMVRSVLTDEWYRHYSKPKNKSNCRSSSGKSKEETYIESHTKPLNQERCSLQSKRYPYFDEFEKRITAKGFIIKERKKTIHHNLGIAFEIKNTYLLRLDEVVEIRMKYGGKQQRIVVSYSETGFHEDHVTTILQAEWDKVRDQFETPKGERSIPDIKASDRSKAGSIRDQLQKLLFREND